MKQYIPLYEDFIHENINIELFPNNLNFEDLNDEKNIEILDKFVEINNIQEKIKNFNKDRLNNLKSYISGKREVKFNNLIFELRKCVIFEQEDIFDKFVELVHIVEAKNIDIKELLKFLSNVIN